MWQVIAGLGIIFVLMEIFMPSMFFLNLALAAFTTAVISVFVSSLSALIWIFCGLSLLFIFTLRPLFLRSQALNKDTKTGIEDKYIGKIATVIEDVDSNSGAITIYDERWQARAVDGDKIIAGQKVQIISNDSLVMNVKKAD